MGRVRIPSSRAREIAAAMYDTSAGRALGPTASSSSLRLSSESPEPPAAEERLYCICLGKDTDSEMILCDSCQNWSVPRCSTALPGRTARPPYPPALLVHADRRRFHFHCIALDHAAARRIESYCCDVCEQMGQGITLCESPLTDPCAHPAVLCIRSPVLHSVCLAVNHLACPPAARGVVQCPSTAETPTPSSALKHFHCPSS